MRIFLRIFQRVGLALFRARVPVMFALVLLLGAGVYTLWRNPVATEAAAAGIFPVEVNVQDVRQTGNALTLTLKEKRGNRRLAMNIGQTEALVIARERGMRLTGEAFMGYELLRDVIQQMGGRVDRVVINDADQTQYFSQIVVSTPSGESRVIKARPADAVALALKAGAPIFVEDRVLEQYGIKGSG